MPNHRFVRAARLPPALSKRPHIMRCLAAQFSNRFGAVARITKTSPPRQRKIAAYARGGSAKDRSVPSTAGPLSEMPREARMSVPVKLDRSDAPLRLWPLWAARVGRRRRLTNSTPDLKGRDEPSSDILRFMKG